ncbi:MAG: glycosyltransferase family 2 protein [Actinomycetota bacterium]|nr:glycosyltransferase family 2 protein [Actinomycetota bacterium]
MTDISVVVVTWNSAAELAGLLPTIEEHLPPETEILVIDNASTDGSVDLVRQWRWPATVIMLKENIGFGRANNVGVREAFGKAVVLLNPDTLLVDDSLLDLARLALQTGALCGPELLNADGSRQPSASAIPGGWEVGLTAIFPAALMPERLSDRCEPWRARTYTKVGWLTGACIAAPRAVLRELGPFDERIELYGEDMDLGLRARRSGIESIFAPDVARVVHLSERSAAKRFIDTGTAWKLRNRRLVVRRELGRPRELYDFSAQVLFHATRYAAKTALRRNTQRERNWLAVAFRPLRS